MSCASSRFHNYRGRLLKKKNKRKYRTSRNRRETAEGTGGKELHKQCVSLKTESGRDGRDHVLNCQVSANYPSPLSRPSDSHRTVSSACPLTTAAGRSSKYSRPQVNAVTVRNFGLPWPPPVITTRRRHHRLRNPPHERPVIYTRRAGL